MTEEAEVINEPETVEQVENESVEATDTEAALDTPEGEESATSEEPEGAEDKPKKSKGGFQRRIDELTKARYEAEQRAQALEAQLQQAQTDQFKSQYEQSKPTLEQYGYDQDAWAQAYEQWAQAGIERQQVAQQEAQQKQQEYQQQLQKQMQLQQRVAEAQTKYPDFMAKVFDPQLPSLQSLNRAAYEAVLDSDSMADVAYYLADNPAEVYKFSSMSPIQAVKEIARIEAKLSKPAKKLTQAPPPPSQVTGKAESVKDPTNMSIEEWMSWRNSQV